MIASTHSAPSRRIVLAMVTAPAVLALTACFEQIEKSPQEAEAEQQSIQYRVERRARCQADPTRSECLSPRLNAQLKAYDTAFVAAAVGTPYADPAFPATPGARVPDDQPNAGFFNTMIAHRERLTATLIDPRANPLQPWLDQAESLLEQAYEIAVAAGNVDVIARFDAPTGSGTWMDAWWDFSSP